MSNQNTWSVTAVPYSADAPTKIGVPATAAAAMACARGRPPNWAASSAVSRMQATWAAMATSRNGHSPPGSAAANAPTNGVSGGWSTYPQAGWRPQMT